MELKRTALNDIHEKLGAKMMPFAGFNMPVRYSSDIEEHLAVRNNVGVFDVSHMGEFLIKGPGALDLIQKLTSNDAFKLKDWDAQYSCLTNETGGIIDDLLVYRYSAEEFVLVVNASNIEKDWNWISERNTNGVQMVNLSDTYSLLAVQGPKAVEVLQRITPIDLSSINFYTFLVGEMAGIPHVMISATGYTGAGGFELYVKNELAEKLWNSIFQAGKDNGIKPIGLGARDTLRLEMGFCLYGNDIDDTTSPIEAGLGWITKFSKEFTNSVNLLKQKEQGVDRKLVSFGLRERGIPRSHYEIFSTDEKKIGEVTSGTMSPILNTGIGMGYVKTGYHVPGTEIKIGIRNNLVKAEVVKSPTLNNFKK
ncbi:MAG: glycine cleavage system aminomethyltransferase GcvT [Bacteroidetes bacterium]|nr:glycine cleavage system aminomethyltransferase GcvT [Bacteroidota bacterium]MDA1121922.1 glycine cleavage system aminomethyltransferase GcvT [Bacteroidota bacterium]